MIDISGQSTDSHLHWKMFDIGSNFLGYLSQCWNIWLLTKNTKSCFKQGILVSLKTVRPHIHGWDTPKLSRAESSCYCPLTVLNSPTWGMAIDRSWYLETDQARAVRGSADTEPGSDSQLPGVGCDDVCICFSFNSHIELRSLNYHSV